MTDRKETTKLLSESLEHYINPKSDPRIYWAKEVTFDYGTSNQIRVDYMKYKPINNTISGLEHGDIYCYEIKSCYDDFVSGHGLNFIGDYNYIVCPTDLIDLITPMIPYGVGLISFTNDKFRPNSMTVFKNA